MSSTPMPESKTAPQQAFFSNSLQRPFFTFPLFSVLATCLLFQWIRRDLGFPLEILGLSLFFATAPNLFPQRIGLLPILGGELIFLAMAAFLPWNIGLLLTVGVALWGTAVTLKGLRPQFRGGVGYWLDSVGVLLFAFLAIYYVWFYGYFSPDFTMELINGTAHKDELFHLAIATMIQEEGIPSTGLHLTPFLPYHVFAHLNFGLWARLCGLPIYELFPLAIPFFTTPVFLQILEAILRRFSYSGGSFLWLPLLLFCTLPFDSGYYPWGYYLVSESYNFSILFLLAFTLTSLNRPGHPGNTLVVLLTFFSKSSMGLFLTVIQLIHILIAPLKPRRKVRDLGLLSLAFVIPFLFYSEQDSSNIKFVFEWFGIQKLTPYPEGHGAFLWGLFNIFFLMVAGFLMYPKKERLPPWTTTLLPSLIAFLAGFLIIHTKINFAYYIFNVVTWTALPFLLIFIHGIWNAPSRLRKAPWVVLLLFMVGNLVPLARARLVEYATYNRPEITEEGRRFMPYFNALRAISQREDQGDYVVEIPRSETNFWNHQQRHEKAKFVPFYIPILSRRPAWNGVTEKLLEEPDFSFGIYRNRAGLDLCRDTSYKGVMRVAQNDAGEVVTTLQPCPPSQVQVERPPAPLPVPTLPNPSFETNLDGWTGPGDCSKGWPGTAIIAGVRVAEATHGTHALKLSSRNHLACMSTPITGLPPQSTLLLTFDAKSLEGRKTPQLFLQGDGNPLKILQQNHRPLDGGWQRYEIFFYTDTDRQGMLTIYAGHKEEPEAFLFDNFHLEKSGLGTPSLANPSFEDGLSDWIGPGDCSAGWPGEARFETSVVKEATHGEKGLRIAAANHLACFVTTIYGLIPHEPYKLFFDSKRLQGEGVPEVAVRGKWGAWQILSQGGGALANGWERHWIIFEAREDQSTLYLYVGSRNGAQAFLLDNFHFGKIDLWERFRSRIPSIRVRVAGE